MLKKAVGYISLASKNNYNENHFNNADIMLCFQDADLPTEVRGETIYVVKPEIDEYDLDKFLWDLADTVYDRLCERIIEGAVKKLKFSFFTALLFCENNFQQ